jgi:hypothetical protein
VSAFVEDQGFWIAAAVACVAVVAVIVAHAQSSRWWGGAGGVAIVGTLAGTLAVTGVPILLVGGITVLAVAGAAARRSLPAGIVATASGAALVAIGVTESTPDAPAWVPVLVGIAAFVTSYTGRAFDSGSPRLTGLCLAITAAGVYAVVPDTEDARVWLGAAAVSAVVGLAPELVPTPSGSSAVMGLVVWNAGVGGWPRASAVVGAIACAGVLALGPFVRRVRIAPLPTVALHIAIVVIAARVAGMTDQVLAAVGVVAVTYAGAGLLLLAVRHSGSRPRPRPRPPGRG